MWSCIFIPLYLFLTTIFLYKNERPVSLTPEGSVLSLQKHKIIPPENKFQAVYMENLFS
jgi:hypothetical protein